MRNSLLLSVFFENCFDLLPTSNDCVAKVHIFHECIPYWQRISNSQASLDNKPIQNQQWQQQNKRTHTHKD